jgi:phage N-6-adenine-methyltransferase
MTLAGVNHSTGTDNWGTPPDFFRRMNERFRFRLDACAESWNTKCPTYYGESDNGLVLPWETWTWCNPPYSQILYWYAKASLEAQKGNSSVLLTFARTDTKAFHKYALQASEIIFLKGRLKFINPETGTQGAPAPAPSMVVIFDATCLGKAQFSTMSAR